MGEDTFVQLVTVSLENHRRFRQRSILRAGAKVVAIVGPNEVGKSTFLRALARLDDVDPWDPKDRPAPVDSGADAGSRLTAYFSLDASDRAALAEFPEAADRAGITPVLAQMGASRLLLRTLDRCLFVEGPSDAILLPQLLREDAGLEVHQPLGYAVVPGIASTSPEDIDGLLTDAHRPLVVVDGDKPGTEYLEMAKSCGLATEQLFQWRSGGTIEDLINPAILSAAANKIVGADLVASERIPKSGRAAWLGTIDSRLRQKTLIAEACIQTWAESETEPLADADSRIQLQALSMQINRVAAIDLEEQQRRSPA